MRVYDYIVVGATLPGLLLAALLLRDGKRVLVLERQRFGGGRISPWRREGYISLPGIPRVRYGDKGALARICRELQIPLHLESLNQAWVLDTDGRLKKITIGKSGPFVGEFLSIWDRLDAVRVRRWTRNERIDDLDEVSLEAWFLRYRLRPTLRKYFQALACECTHCTDLDRASAGETLRCFERAIRSRTYVAYPKRGWVDLLDCIIRKVETEGEIGWGRGVDSFEVETRRVVGVRVHGEVMRARGVVSAMPCQKTIRLLHREMTAPEYVDLCQRLEPSSALIVDLALAHKVFKRKGFWFFLDPPSYGIFLSNLNYIHAPAGKQLATFVCPCSRQQANQPAFVQMLEKKIEQNIRIAVSPAELPVEWIRSRVVPVLDSVAIRADQPRTERPGYTVPGVEGLYLVGDSTCAPGCCWEIEYESVLACHERIRRTEI